MMPRIARGALVEYGLSLPPTALVFEFNPQSLASTRNVQIYPGEAQGTEGGYDFTSPKEAGRAAQAVSSEPESISLEVLFDATDRMKDADPIAGTLGVQPELDTLRTMSEPKSQGPGGVQVLSGLGMLAGRAFEKTQSPSVLLFVWGTHVLPVFLTSVRITEEAHLPSLVPYRARVGIEMQIIESSNPFFIAEKVRQAMSAALNTGQLLAGNLPGGLW